MEYTDLTKVMLQGRRFFRPFDLETRGLRRVLHPFAGFISALGFAVAFGTFLWKDVVIDQEKETVTALTKAQIDFFELKGLDQIAEAVKSPGWGVQMSNPVMRLSVLLNALPITPEAIETEKKMEAKAREIEDRYKKENHPEWPLDVQDWTDLENIIYPFFNEEIHRSEDALEFLTRASYVLYGFGLLVGVLGQLVGIEPEGPVWPD